MDSAYPDLGKFIFENVGPKVGNGDTVLVSSGHHSTKLDL